MTYSYQPTLDCQGCDEILRYLTYAEAQRVADNPQNFIHWGKDCIENKMHIDPEFR